VKYSGFINYYIVFIESISQYNVRWLHYRGVDHGGGGGAGVLAPNICSGWALPLNWRESRRYAVGYRRGCPLLTEGGVWGAVPLPRIFFLNFYIKMVSYRAFWY